MVAHELGVPVTLIKILPTNTFTNANGSVTGGSMTSELNCHVSAFVKISEFREDSVTVLLSFL